MKRKVIITGLLIVNLAILGGMLVPAFVPARSKHLPISTSYQLLRYRLNLVGRCAPAVIFVGLIVTFAGVAMNRKGDDSEPDSESSA